ncbi:hypothetical protein V6N13_148972 [Hibiscus sabdariffa]|uniref:Uncharacterized protein n=1 Tax=Hibiscus sabdariffa TaxID=183260 RepID=A0ABR2EIQ5_9ROSI
MAALSPNLQAKASAVVTEDVQTVLFAPPIILPAESCSTAAIPTIFYEASKDASQFTFITPGGGGSIVSGR